MKELALARCGACHGNYHQSVQDGFPFCYPCLTWPERWTISGDMREFYKLAGDVRLSVDKETKRLIRLDALVGEETRTYRGPREFESMMLWAKGGFENTQYPKLSDLSENVYVTKEEPEYAAACLRLFSVKKEVYCGLVAAVLFGVEHIGLTQAGLDVARRFKGYWKCSRECSEEELMASIESYVDDNEDAFSVIFAGGVCGFNAQDIPIINKGKPRFFDSLYQFNDFCVRSIYEYNGKRESAIDWVFDGELLVMKDDQVEYVRHSVPPENVMNWQMCYTVEETLEPTTCYVSADALKLPETEWNSDHGINSERDVLFNLPFQHGNKYGVTRVKLRNTENAIAFEKWFWKLARYLLPGGEPVIDKYGLAHGDDRVIECDGTSRFGIKVKMRSLFRVLAGLYDGRTKGEEEILSDMLAGKREMPVVRSRPGSEDQVKHDDICQALRRLFKRSYGNEYVEQFSSLLCEELVTRLMDTSIDPRITSDDLAHNWPYCLMWYKPPRAVLNLCVEVFGYGRSKDHKYERKPPNIPSEIYADGVMHRSCHEFSGHLRVSLTKREIRDHKELFV